MNHLTRAQRTAALHLFENFLTNMAHALDHIDAELANTSPWPSTTMGDGGSKPTGTRSPVERAAIDARARLDNTAQQLFDDYTAIINICRNGTHTANQAGRERVPVLEGRCTFGTTSGGWEGWMVWRNREARYTPDGDLLHRDIDCEKWPAQTPVVVGMCDDCLGRMNGWRDIEGLERITRDADARAYLDRRNVKSGPDGRFRRAS